MKRCEKKENWIQLKIIKNIFNSIMQTQKINRPNSHKTCLFFGDELILLLSFKWGVKMERVTQNLS